jgi:hypothetical protein
VGSACAVTSTANAINASFDPALPYDFARDIAPVAGVGTSTHLSGELFKSLAGVQFTHVPLSRLGTRVD